MILHDAGILELEASPVKGKKKTAAMEKKKRPKILK